MCRCRAAAAARGAGHAALADELAARARAPQLALLRATLAEDGDAAGGFDALHERLAALVAALGCETEVWRALPAAPVADDEPAFSLDDELPDGLPTCSICLSAHVDTAVTPCFHAAFCSRCARTLLDHGAPCPICRGGVRGSQKIYL